VELRLTDGTLLVVAPINFERAIIPFSRPFGTYEAVAIYAGSDAVEPATSAPFTFAVIPNTTTTTLTVPTIVAYAYGQPATITATVAAAPFISPDVKPTGSVQLTDVLTNAVLGVAELNANAVATFNMAAINAGSYSLVAQYLGAAEFDPSVSIAKALSINQATQRSEERR